MNPPLVEALSSRLLPITSSSGARAAVILLLSRGDEPALLYTKRALHLRSHPGEVCFPGGMREPGDESLVATALREMEEEIGVPGTQVQLLGRMPEFHTRAGTKVVPFVASVDENYPLVPSLDELDSIFWVPLALFNQGIKVREDVFEREGVSYSVPVYHYQGYEIWGFTAAVTARLLAMLQQTALSEG